MSETSLIVQFNRREKEAWDKIHLRFGSRLFNFINHKIHNKEQAKEMANDCFVKIYEKGLEFEAIPQLETFLFKKAKNDALNYLKSSARKMDNSIEYTPKHDSEENIEDALVREYEHRSLVNDIIQEVQKHPKERREIFELLFFGKKKAAEVAAIKGIHVSNVHDYKYKLLKDLREKFGAEVDKLNF